MKKTTLLIIEDEEAIRDMLRFSLLSANYTILDAENTTQASQILADHIPDLIILDWMLPGKNGIEFIKWLKKQKLLQNIPVIMLTAKAEEESKVNALTHGADDYITKPFSINELIARIKAILRRGPLASPSNEITMDGLILNIATHKVSIDGHPITLTPVEYKMLHFFMTHPNRVYDRDQLITHIWGGNVYIDTRTIDVQIRRLRDRLKPNYHSFIQTVRGVGYIFSQKAHEEKK